MEGWGCDRAEGKGERGKRTAVETRRVGRETESIADADDASILFNPCQKYPTWAETRSRQAEGSRTTRT